MSKTIRIALARDEDRRAIYRIRHEVYAEEIRQHACQPSGELSDALDPFNTFITAFAGDEIVGFVSVTPPSSPRFSIEKYFTPAELPFVRHDRLYEIRLLTIRKLYRGRELATLLMYAALRWIEAAGGTRVVAIGREEILGLYEKAGLARLGHRVRSGEVTFELLTATTDALRQRCRRYARPLMKLSQSTDWQLGIPFFPPAPCFHGGAFFDAIGDEFDRLDRSRRVVNADVLDAWFPPSPRVTNAIREYLPWLAKTSPPTNCEGLVRTIAAARSVPAACVVPGAGSSDLIYRALRHWLTASSRVLILDPTYGEYAHVAERVIGCQVERLNLSRHLGYRLSPGDLAAAMKRKYDLVIVVNPNSPTGGYLSREALVDVLRRAPKNTRVWIDETYIDYLGSDQSLESFAAASEHVVVCKSMSKVYALSGMRAAYLCAPPHVAHDILSITPPWVVGLLAQVAAVEALNDPGYYAERYAETDVFRSELVGRLRSLDAMDVLEGPANFVLCHLRPDGPSAARVCDSCRAHDVFLRDLSSLSPRLGPHALRIAIKDRPANQRIAEILARSLGHDGAIASPLQEVS